jgi:hypothetical protein
MYYQVSKTIPPNTSKYTPVIENVEILESFLWGIYIFFPPGPCGLAGFRIKIGEWQFFPALEGQWFFGDDVNILIPIGYWLEHIPETFTIEFYNNDDTYEHTITVGLIAVPPEVVGGLPYGGGYGISHRPF